jgi:hypothetical protein
MATLETLNEIANSFTPNQQVQVSKWYGKPCLKSQNKVFVVLWGKTLAFKLTGTNHAKALALPKARLFDPRGNGHAMKEWVQLDAASASAVQDIAKQAYAYAVKQS